MESKGLDVRRLRAIRLFVLSRLAFPLPLTCGLTLSSMSEFLVVGLACGWRVGELLRNPPLWTLNPV